MLVKSVNQVAEKITQIFAALDLVLKVAFEGCGLTFACLVIVCRQF